MSPQPQLAIELTWGERLVRYNIYIYISKDLCEITSFDMRGAKQLSISTYSR